jgi:hypothetical protein
VDSDLFEDILPPPGSCGRTRAYADALRRAAAGVVSAASSSCPPPHTALVAAEGCLLHRAHASLLRACAAATQAARAELLAGAATQHGVLADLAPAQEQLAQLSTHTLPLVRMRCLSAHLRIQRI